MKLSNWAKLIIAIVASECAGLAGSVFTIPAIGSWYRTLQKPVFSPPDWVFGPVWTTLYFLMGISAFLVWKKGSERAEVRIALAAFVFQLVLNMLWSVIFFGLRNPGLALVEILVLGVSILATLVLFARVSRPAAWLLVPYLLWVTFAAYLNYSIWMLN